MGLPGTLDGSFGCMVQENYGFSFFPGPGGPDFWSDGIFMTRELAPNNYINFLAVGEYWFSMIIANSTNSLDAQYVTFPASGAGGIGFADGSTTNADFVAVGVTGPDLFLGPGATNASKALYISQGTLGQPGDPGRCPTRRRPRLLIPRPISRVARTMSTRSAPQRWAMSIGITSPCWDISRLTGMAPPPWTPNTITIHGGGGEFLEHRAGHENEQHHVGLQLFL